MVEPQHALESVWTDVQGRKVHARVSTSAETNSRPPVVLMHGFVVSSHYLEPTAELLAKDFYVYAPDLPGFGLSEKPEEYDTIETHAEWLIAYLDAVGLERPAFLANSMGCQVVVEAAVRYPTRIGRMVLSSPVIDRHARNVITQIWRTLRDYPGERPRLIAIHVSDYYRAGLRRFLHSMQAMMSYPIEEKLPYIHVPVLVVRGDRDSIVPQCWAEEVTNLLPRGQLVVLPGTAHAMTYSAPLELARVSSPFLARANDCGFHWRFLPPSS